MQKLLILRTFPGRVEGPRRVSSLTTQRGTPAAVHRSKINNYNGTPAQEARASSVYGETHKSIILVRILQVSTTKQSGVTYKSAHATKNDESARTKNYEAGH